MARVCLEATGVYSLNLALALQRTTRVEVMVVNPRAIKDFQRARLTRAKTDRVDALGSSSSCSAWTSSRGLRRRRRAQLAAGQPIWMNPPGITDFTFFDSRSLWRGLLTNCHRQR
jgi:transposase